MENDDGNDLIGSAKVRKRYDVSKMWVERRLKDDPTFPRPLYICGRRFWRVAELVAWERTKAAGHSVAA